MQEDPGLRGTEDIELPVRNNQTPPNVAPAQTPDDDSDEENVALFHDALSDLHGSTDDLPASVIQPRTDMPARASRLKRVKKILISLNETTNSLIGLGVFFLAVISVVYTVWTVRKDYYDFCYERNQTLDPLSQGCKSTLKEGISPPFSWHAIRSASTLAAESLRQGQNKVLSALDSRLCNTRPTVVFLSGASCAMLLAGTAFCIAKHGRAAGVVWVQTVRLPEAWIATELARQNHNWKGRKRHRHITATHEVKQPNEDVWTTAIKSGVAFSDLHRPRRGFTRTDSEPDSEVSQPIVNNELSDQAQMRHNAEILAAYISHLRKCYSPRRPVVYIGFLPLSAGCIVSTLPCSKLDLCQSLKTLETRHNFSTASIRQKDLSYESGEVWTLHLPSDCCLLEKLLTIDPFTRNTSTTEMDHFCDVRQRSDSAACHINHFFSVTISGDAISDNVIILVHSRSKLRYTSLLLELQDSAEQLLPPVWFQITPISRGSNRNRDGHNPGFGTTLLRSLDIEHADNDGRESLFVFRHLDANPMMMSLQDDLFPPLPGLQELHAYWEHGSCDVDCIPTCDEVLLTCSENADWTPNLGLEDIVTSVYSQNPASDEPVSTAIDALFRVNDWLLHNLKCSAFELNRFMRLLDETLATFLLEDPDLNSNLTIFWRQNMTDQGFGSTTDDETSLDASRHFSSDYHRYLRPVLPSAEVNFVHQSVLSTKSSAVELATSGSRAAGPRTTAPSLRKNGLPRLHSMPDLSAPSKFEQSETWSSSASLVSNMPGRRAPQDYHSKAEEQIPLSATSNPSTYQDQMLEEEECTRCLVALEISHARVIDLQVYHDELRLEAIRRKGLGLELDARAHETLQRFEKEYSTLALELDKAQADLELAEVTLSNRKMNKVADSRSNLSQELDIRHQDDYYDTAPMLHSNLKGQSAAAILAAHILCQGEKDSFQVYDDLGDGETVNKARFINQWILHRLLHDQREAIRFADTLLDIVPNPEAFDVKAIVQSYWNQDGLERNFITTFPPSDKNLANSLATETGYVDTLNNKVMSQPEHGFFKDPYKRTRGPSWISSSV